ncbi:MAG: hypothetical protein [Lokiarchaeia virus VerdaV1]|uniref:Uncharacterized protein n=1 Tax=Lokiarchaeia virus VerdaV1 TaxID=3070170 RepID=A0AA35CPF6_9CAUD|nr:MAG: hypothetical protein QIT41_gp15 [Lokiarchaeia virus VerdaV1]BDI54864.1 MAG: hypothetical protein [Lokiarchaeia virus VerdaV1]
MVLNYGWALLKETIKVRCTDILMDVISILDIDPLPGDSRVGLCLGEIERTIILVKPSFKNTTDIELWLADQKSYNAAGKFKFEWQIHSDTSTLKIDGTNAYIYVFIKETRQLHKVEKGDGTTWEAERIVLREA